MKKNVGISYKAFAVILAAVLILGGTIGSTMAWLIDSKDVTNVFTDSDISIELTESPNLNLKMIPGHTITKDPNVTVKAGSEDCYLFVKLEKSDNYSTYLDDYVITDGWTKLDGANDVYYKEVASSDKDQEFAVLKDNKVTVREDVTKEKMNEIKNNNVLRPTLTVKAYAVQLYKTNANKFDVSDAWAKATETSTTNN